MAKASLALSSFTAGELSPKLEGRVNLEKYAQGCSELTNFLILPQGGATRRPGTQFVGQVKSPGSETRLIPFQFKTSDTYILEFGNLYIRVWRNGQQVIDSTSKTISTYSSGNDTVFNTNPLKVHFTTSHGYSVGDEIYMNDPTINSSTYANSFNLGNRNYIVKEVIDASTVTLKDLHNLDVDNRTTVPGALAAAYYDATNGTCTKIYEITTPYTTAQLSEIKFVQSADTMYLVHPSHAIRTLTRSAHNNWTLATATLTQPSNLLNASSDNYPSVVGFFEQRLIFGATNNAPQTLWFSKSGHYTNFTVGTNDDDALEYTLASQEVNAIRWLSSTRVLVIGTSGGEYVVTATNDAPISPTNTVIRKYSNYGSANHKPVQVADTTLFLQRNKRKVREFKYIGDVDESGYQAPDLTVLAEHITEGGIEEFSYQQDPDSIVWCRRNDGTLLGMTYRREEQVVAWHKHILGGRYGNCTVEFLDANAFSTAEKAAANKFEFTTSNGMVITLQGEVSGSGDPTTPSGLTFYFKPASNTLGAIATAFRNAIQDPRPLAAIVDNAHPVMSADSARNAYLEANVTGGGATVTVWQSFDQTKLLTVTNPNKRMFKTTNQTQAVVESIATLPTENGEDELYMIVKRTIRGTGYTKAGYGTSYNYSTPTHSGIEKRYIEKLTKIDFEKKPYYAWFVDSGLANPIDLEPTSWKFPSYPTTSRNKTMDMWHLMGETVQAIAEGALAGGGKVPNTSTRYSSGNPYPFAPNTAPGLTQGSTDADGAYKTAQLSVNTNVEGAVRLAGLGFVSTLSTLRLEGGSQDGTSQGKPKRIHGCTVRLIHTSGMQMATNSDELNYQFETISFRDSTMPASEPIELFSGDKDIAFVGTFYENDIITIRQDTALPLTVLAIFPRLTTFDI